MTKATASELFTRFLNETTVAQMQHPTYRECYEILQQAASECDGSEYTAPDKATSNLIGAVLEYFPPIAKPDFLGSVHPVLHQAFATIL